MPVTADSIKGSVQDLDGRVGSLELTADGLKTTIKGKVDGKDIASTINQTAQSVLIQASKIDLKGYVKMEDFEAVTGWADNFAGNSISANDIACGRGDFDELVFGTLAGEYCSWKSKSVLVSRGNLTVNKRYLTLMKGDGTTVTLDVVTDVSLSNSRSETINYLGKD